MVKIPLRSLVPAESKSGGTEGGSGTAEAELTFCTQLRAHGYSVLELDEEVHEQLITYRECCAHFLQQPYDVKQRLAPRQDDPLLRVWKKSEMCCASPLLTARRCGGGVWGCRSWVRCRTKGTCSLPN